MPRDIMLARCKEALELLEGIPPQGFADTRIELAWNVVSALLYENAQTDVSVRALLAAFPADSAVSSRIWERRWLTALAVTERLRGNIVQSLKAEAAGLVLAQEIGDVQGQAAALANLAVHALLAARFDEALQLSEIAIEKATDALSVDVLAGVHISRGNTFLYLGRYEESLEQARDALIAVGPVRLVSDKGRIVLAKALAAESLIALGRVREAAVPVEAAERWSRDSGAWAGMYEARRVRALLDVARGEVLPGLTSLRKLRSELEVKTPSLLADLLQSEYRAHVMAGDEASALEVLKEIRTHFTSQAEQTLKGLREAPFLAGYLREDRRLAEIDRYLEAKSVLSRTVRPGNEGWDFLVSLAASSTAPEDPSLEHGLRVGRLGSLVAASLRLGTPFERAVMAAGLVHDVGKVGVPAELLLTRQALSDDERSLYDSHSETGAQLLEQAEYPDKRVVINVARHHHAMFDGHGGGVSLRGEDIPLEARIIGACDAFDALIVGRPRHPAVSSGQALEIIFRRSGRDFDPCVVEALVDVVRRLPSETSGLVAQLSETAEDMAFFGSQRALKRAARSSSRDG
jgi:HD-GYP domain-containing protein (c-di-GMP phosphodiesterase class II)